MAQIPYLDVQNLSKRFGAQVLFENISFSIAEGQRVGLIAQNGTGKSTLLAMLTGTKVRMVAKWFIAMVCAWGF